MKFWADAKEKEGLWLECGPPLLAWVLRNGDKAFSSVFSRAGPELTLSWTVRLLWVSTSGYGLPPPCTRLQDWTKHIRMAETEAAKRDEL